MVVDPLGGSCGVTRTNLPKRADLHIRKRGIGLANLPQIYILVVGGNSHLPITPFIAPKKIKKGTRAAAQVPINIKPLFSSNSNLFFIFFVLHHFVNVFVRYAAALLSPKPSSTIRASLRSQVMSPSITLCLKPIYDREKGLKKQRFGITPN